MTDLDLFITGDSAAGELSTLYRNEGGSPVNFSAQSGPDFPFIKLSASYATWADYDRDGDPDLLLTGYNFLGDTGTPTTRLYRNGPCQVSNEFDVPDGDVQALINAIHAANQTGTAGEMRSVAAPAVINLAANGHYTLTTPDNGLAGGNGLPVVTGLVTINGNGATIARSPEPATPLFRLLYVTGTLSLDNVILSHGHISSTSPAERTGGAILNNGVLSLTNSTVQHNTNSFGGGVGNFENGVLTLQNVTVQENQARDQASGGLSNLGQMTVRQSVIRNNQAGQDGGGIANFGQALLEESTITGNSAFDDGGGVVNRDGTILIRNSVISLNLAERTNDTLGGGLANQAQGRNARTQIQESQVISNSSANFGGGLANSLGSGLRAELLVSHSEIAGN